MIAWTKTLLANMLAKSGRRLTRFPLGTYLRDFQIDCVLDVGANEGQYARELRKLGYSGRIESFEPLPSILPRLRGAAAADPLWNVHAHALGEENCVRSINILQNSPSSSFLPLDQQISTAQENLSVVGTVDVEIKRLDDVFESCCAGAKSVLLKIDTQGFERNVITGGLHSLNQIAWVQMELSLVVNYEGEAIIEEMLAFMRGQGFVPWWLSDGFRNPRTLQMYQMDVFFVRQALVGGQSA